MSWSLYFKCFGDSNQYTCYCLVHKLCPTLRPHGLQHTRLLCPPLSTRVCSKSCLLNIISSSATLFSFCLQSFPASGSIPMSWIFASGAQSIGASASASVLPMNIQGWCPDLLFLISLLTRDSQESSLTPQFKSINSMVLSLLYGSTLTSVIALNSILDTFQPEGAHLLESYLFAFSCHPWGKNTGVGCHFLLQWTMFSQNSSLWPNCLG